MKKGFIVDKHGQPKFSWIWVTTDECPFRDTVKLEEGDVVYTCDDLPDDDYLPFHSNLIADEMMKVVNEHLESINVHRESAEVTHT